MLRVPGYEERHVRASHAPLSRGAKRRGLRFRRPHRHEAIQDHVADFVLHQLRRRLHPAFGAHQRHDISIDRETRIRSRHVVADYQVEFFAP